MPGILSEPVLIILHPKPSTCNCKKAKQILYQLGEDYSLPPHLSPKQVFTRPGQAQLSLRQLSTSTSEAPEAFGVFPPLSLLTPPFSCLCPAHALRDSCLCHPCPRWWTACCAAPFSPVTFKFWTQGCSAHRKHHAQLRHLPCPRRGEVGPGVRETSQQKAQGTSHWRLHSMLCRASSYVLYKHTEFISTKTLR